MQDIRLLLQEITDLLKDDARRSGEESLIAQARFSQSLAHQQRSMANQEKALRAQRFNSIIYRVALATAGLALFFAAVAFLRS